jgi:hypothetical protein
MLELGTWLGVRWWGYVHGVVRYYGSKLTQLSALESVGKVVSPEDSFEGSWVMVENV